VRVGQIDVIPVLDGTFRLDGGAMFGIVPKPLWERRLSADDRNRVPLAIRPVLVRTGGQHVLIDAGVGDKLGPKEIDIYGIDRTQPLERSLAVHGLGVEAIDVVIASHLHFDHAGGFTTRRHGRLVPTFPHARYLVHRGEWDDALHSHERNRASYLPADFLPLLEAGVVEFFEADGELLPGITAVRTGGHTRHHQILRIDSAGQTAVFAADLLPTTAHIDNAWIAGYDLYPMDTLAFKRQFLQEAVDREYVIFFEHDPQIAAGIIREDAGRRRIEPV
jgi:glyoxylase-like metal-dependent hydrolase (beta-lactamase superfamily II)